MWMAENSGSCRQNGVLYWTIYAQTDVGAVDYDWTDPGYTGT
jgi:hypothetical protein